MNSEIAAISSRLRAKRMPCVTLSPFRPAHQQSIGIVIARQPVTYLNLALALRAPTPDCPRPGGELNASARSGCEPALEPGAQRVATPVIQRRHIGRRRTGALKKRAPVVVERREVSRDIERMRGHMGERGGGEQRCHRVGAAERETLALVE